MAVTIDPVTRHRVDVITDELCEEFAGRLDRAVVGRIVDDSLERLATNARVVDFVPMMAGRFARERLAALARSGGERPPGSWDVVFVSLSGGGRGQIAAALTTLLSERRVAVHSAGTAALGEIDPGVATVIAELGVDERDAFARPVSDEVLAAADVVVTMGHSVGLIEIPAGTRHEDWRVGDPIGAPLEEVRRVRGDIEHRVRALLGALGVPACAAR